MEHTKSLNEALVNSDYRNIVLSVINRFSQSKNLNKPSFVDHCIWRAYEKYNEKHSSLAGFNTYLWNVAKNACLKDNKFENHQYVAMGEEPLSFRETKESQVYNLVSDLDDYSKGILNDRFVQNLTLSEIAEKRNISKECARKHIKQLLKQLS